MANVRYPRKIGCGGKGWGGGSSSFPHIIDVLSLVERTGKVYVLKLGGACGDFLWRLTLGRCVLCIWGSDEVKALLTKIFKADPNERIPLTVRLE